MPDHFAAQLRANALDTSTPHAATAAQYDALALRCADYIDELAARLPDPAPVGTCAISTTPHVEGWHYMPKGKCPAFVPFGSTVTTGAGPDDPIERTRLAMEKENQLREAWESASSITPSNAVEAALIEAGNALVTMFDEDGERDTYTMIALNQRIDALTAGSGPEGGEGRYKFRVNDRVVVRGISEPGTVDALIPADEYGDYSVRFRGGASARFHEESLRSITPSESPRSTAGEGD